MIEKYDWLQRAKETYNFHIRHKLDAADKDEKWSLAKTAKILRRSIGSISEDILIASWYKTHRVQLEKFEYAKDALEFIRKREREQHFQELE